MGSERPALPKEGALQPNMWVVFIMLFMIEKASLAGPHAISQIVKKTAGTDETPAHNTRVPPQDNHRRPTSHMIPRDRQSAPTTQLYSIINYVID